MLFFRKTGMLFFRKQARTSSDNNKHLTYSLYPTS